LKPGRVRTISETDLEINAMTSIKQFLALSTLSFAALGVSAGTSIAATNGAQMHSARADVSAAQGLAPAYYTYENKHYVYKYNGHYYNHRAYKNGHWSYY
jgi:hypothetical protein